MLLQAGSEDSDQTGRMQMCTATSRGPQLQNLENPYRCEEPQKEEFREFDIYFLIENNNYQQMHYTKSVKTLWNTTCVFVFFFFFFCFFFFCFVFLLFFLFFSLPSIRFTASAFRKLPSIYVFSYFPFGFEGRIWDLIVSVPDHCLSFYFQ